MGADQRARREADGGAVMRDYWIDTDGSRWVVPRIGKRMQFSNLGPAKLRAFVFRRDGFMCVHCGWQPESIPSGYDGHLTVIGADVNGKRRELQLDHVEALANGGSNHPSNLQTLCFGCNAAKRDRYGW